jgi:hypothetical protein
MNYKDEPMSYDERTELDIENKASIKFLGWVFAIFLSLLAWGLIVAAYLWL